MRNLLLASTALLLVGTTAANGAEPMTREQMQEQIELLTH